MVHFAVCEDNKEQAAEICTYLKEIPDSQIFTFDCGQAFLDAVTDGTKFDIILLDIELPDMLIKRSIVRDLVSALLLQKFQPQALLLHAQLIAQQAAAQGCTEHDEQDCDDRRGHVLRVRECHK